jgi:CDP-glycerol glycerophosphotransferase (TagB/SpsB family)
VPTVLYAPTWEGFYDQSDYCSVVRPGLDAVRSMVDSGRFRVLFKPHPASGGRRQDVAEAVEEIERLLSSGAHRRLPDAPEALYEAMREADVLISDVSSVLSDWLACRRPYVVTNPQMLATAELHERFPTTQGGAVLEPDGDVLALLDEALASDPLAARRSRLARHLIGPPREDPLQDFVDEVSAAVRRSSVSGAASREAVLTGIESVR